MKKIYRTGIDAEVAFSSNGKKLSIEHPNNKKLNQKSYGSREKIKFLSICKSNTTFKKIMLIRVKSIIRPVFVSVFRLSKPLLRPVFVRMKRYFTESIKEEIKYDIQSASVRLISEVRSIKDALEQQLERKSNSPPISIQMEALSELESHLKEIKHELHQSLIYLKKSAENMATVDDTKNLENNVLPLIKRIETYSHSSARRVAVNCAPGEVLVKASVGYVLCSTDDHALLACLVDTGELEAGTRKLIEKFIRPGDIYVDVGANIGLHTLAAAKKMNGKGKVYAFEPYLPTVDLLKKSLWLNGLTELVQVMPFALSSETGRHRLHLGQTSGHHSLYELAENSSSTAESVEVDVTRLDEVISASEQIHLMKIDAEGAELEVIAGAERLIENNPDTALIVEFGPSHLTRVGVDIDDWFDVFTRLGMDFQVIDPLSGKLQVSSVDKLRNVESVNLFFSRPGSEAWRRLID